VTRDDRRARVALSRVCEPGLPALATAVEQRGAVEVWDALRAGRPVGGISPQAVEGAALRAAGYDVERDLRRLDQLGARVLVPSDAEWPGHRLTWEDELREAPPMALFVRGERPLADAVERSVSVVGARAASAYGAHVAGELALGVADRGWTVVSGGAYGVDGAAHRGALASTGASTLAVLACGIDVAYPKGHDQLLARIAAEGLLVSEHPPGCAPTRVRFLVRNRLIAALSVGTVVVEAAVRSGSLTTARQAGDLGRVLMAVPGPVTSEMSSGAHQLMRDRDAVCVCSAAHVLDAVGALGADAAEEPRAPLRPRDEVAADLRRVLDAVPVRRWAGEASIAKTAGVSAAAVQQALPPLQVAGLVEQSLQGWRLTPLGAGRPVPSRAAP
jgi:DNA processing protein